jgi:hypothetical protein
MPFSVRAAPGREQLAESVRAWLREGRLEPEQELSIELRVAERLELPADARTPVLQRGIVMRAGPPENVTRVVWEVQPAYADIVPGSSVAQVVLSEAAAANLEPCLRSFLTLVVALLLRRAGWHHLHAATLVDPNGRGWLFAGNTGAGKSTTTALLASRGWQVGTDDIAFMVGAGDHVDLVSRYGPIALRDGGYELLRAHGGRPLPQRGKTGFTPEELGGRWTPRVTPCLIAFTEHGGDTTTVESVAPRDVLAHLMRSSLTGVVAPDSADAYLDILTRLGRQAKSFHLKLGHDIFDDPDLLLRLVP